MTPRWLAGGNTDKQVRSFSKGGWYLDESYASSAAEETDQTPWKTERPRIGGGTLSIAISNTATRRTIPSNGILVFLIEGQCRRLFAVSLCYPPAHGLRNVFSILRRFQMWLRTGIWKGEKVSNEKQ